MFARELELLNAPHVAFSDLPLIVDVTGTRSTWSAETQAVVGFLLGERVLRILRKYLK